MRLNRWICLLVGLWRTLWCGVPVSGCDFCVEEENILARVQTSKCDICGRYCCAWEKVA